MDVSIYAAWTIRDFVAKSVKLIHSATLESLSETLDLYLKDAETPLRSNVKDAVTDVQHMIAVKFGRTRGEIDGVLSHGTVRSPSTEASVAPKRPTPPTPLKH
jgi:hypothetical protein